MPEILLILLLLLVVIVIALLFLLLNKTSNNKSFAVVENQLAALEKNLERTERFTKQEIAITREEMNTSLNNFNNSVLSRMSEIAHLQKNQLDTFANQLSVLTNTNEHKLEKMRGTMEQNLRLLQEDNNKKLEQMRITVDEKLHATLEKRLGDSFKLVSDRLELVHKGLGEMQTLASGVGDLKKVLTNVKTRGTWGEIQLGNLLEQILTPEQYATNISTKKGSTERVEFAIKLPGANGELVYLPIDAKFPQEDYQRLLDAQEHADVLMVEEYSKKLEQRIKAEARDIKDKYLDPPNTTDFAVMFLPTEGLYAEVLRRAGLGECLQRDYRIIIAGPTTLAALLNSLQMGFRTLAVEKRSSEIWALLGAIKTEFGKFGTLLEKTQKKLQEASNTIENAAKKTRTIERKLQGVQELPEQQIDSLIGDIED